MSFTKKQIFDSGEISDENIIDNLKVQYFTYFLNPINQIFIPGTKIVTKSNIIKEVLSKKIDFAYKGNNKDKNLHFIPVQNEGNYIYGKIYRKAKISINKLDNGDIKKDNIDNYPYINIFINISDDPKKGQKIAIQNKNHIFSSNKALLIGLSEYLNIEIQNYGYVLNINPVVIKNIFWDTIRKYKEIEKITLNLAVPNLFGSEGKLEEELKNVNESFNATNASFEFENKGGLLKAPEQNPFLKSAADYIEKGGGEFTIKAKGVSLQIKSGDNIKSKNIDNLEISGKNLDLSKIFDIDF